MRWRPDILLALPVVRSAALRLDRALAGVLAFASRARPRRPPSAEVGALVRDALDAALLPAGHRIAVLGDPGPLTDARVTASESLERLAPAAVPATLRRLGATADAVLVVAPVWPSARSGARTLRRAAWWTEAAAAAGLEPLVELRRQAGGRVCLVLRQAVAPAPPLPAAPRSASRPLRLRLNDDLSRDTSFAWISASIALALERTGVAVSIAPTELPRSLEPGRRRALARLIERGAPPRSASEIGWTHFWEAYRRPLRGEHPLALYATNVRFARSERGAWDPWMAELVSGSLPLAPISSFCREVLVAAGVAPERTDVVPLAPTEGLEPGGGGSLRGARTLKVLHVTNASDPLRHGTDLALAGFAEAFAPRDDVTLVVRDYWHGRRRPRRAGGDARGPRLRRPLPAGLLPAGPPRARFSPRSTSCSRRSAAKASGSSCSTRWRAAWRRSRRASAGRPISSLPRRSFPLPYGVEAGAPRATTRASWRSATARCGRASHLRMSRWRCGRRSPTSAETARRGSRAREVAAGFTWERTADAIVASVERRAGQALRAVGRALAPRAERAGRRGERRRAAGRGARARGSAPLAQARRGGRGAARACGR